MRLLYTEDGGAGLLDGGTRSRVYRVGRGVYMGLYCANLSFVEFRTMVLGIHLYKDTTGMTNHTINQTS